MTRVTITCPITWWEQCDWIQKNCKEWRDDTCWAGWQIGYNDIHYWVSDKDAIIFWLRWG